MGVRRYLLVLDMDLLALDEELELQPINYLVERQEKEPCQVTVLSLASQAQTKLPAMEMLLGAKVGKMPIAPKPDHDIAKEAENRMNLAVRHLTTIGCETSGIISDDDLAPAVGGGGGPPPHHHPDEKHARAPPPPPPRGPRPAPPPPPPTTTTS
jgi:hypothetical protein